MNRRKDDRYCISEIPLPGIGAIVEISRKGLKIRKEPTFSHETPKVTLTLGTLEIKADIRWEDDSFMGLQLERAFTDPAFLTKRLKKAKESIAPPQMKILLDDAIQNYKKDDILISLINLLIEVESPEPNIRKIGTYLEHISKQEEKEEPSEPEEEELREIKDDPKSCKDELISRASDLQSSDEKEIKDIYFAINILGLDNVRELILNYVHKLIFESTTPIPGFENYEKHIVLKSVVFNNLCRFFGFQDIQSGGASLLSFESVGIELLIKESSGILDQYYKSSSRLYSEVSRMYEKAFFGTDPLEVNKTFFENGLNAFDDFSNGYVLAHCTLNPQYAPSEDLKISLSKNGLIFSYMAYLTFLAVKFLLDKDRVSGFVLVMKLRGKGLDLSKIEHFFNKSISDAETILRDLTVKGTISRPALPEGSFHIEPTLGNDVRFENLVRCFKDFDRRKVKRLALRYEDDSYAHFILGKLMSTDSLDLISRTVCVVPCRNISDDPWYVKDFSYFDLLVFKDIHKLSPVQLAAFLKLWHSFEGQIVATFSSLAFLDYSNPGLHGVLKNALVDFPSFFLNETVYRKMIEHTKDYLEPFLGDQKVEWSRYLSDVYTMNHIKADVLLTKEIF